MRTKVAIVGGGPAGMLLSHLLWRADIDNVVVEQRSREYVEARIRAGVIEQGTSDLLRSLGLGSRMDREGFVHEGVTISNARSPFRVDFKALVGRAVMVYGQTEIQKDLYDSGVGAGWPIVFEAEDVQLHDITDGHPSITYDRPRRATRRSTPTTSPDAMASTASAAMRSPPTSGASTNASTRSVGWACCRRPRRSAMN